MSVCPLPLLLLSLSYLCLPACCLTPLLCPLQSLSPYLPAFLSLTGYVNYLLLNILWFLMSWGLSLPSPPSLPLVQQLGGSIWTEAFPMTCLPQVAPSYPASANPATSSLAGPVTCIGCVFPTASPMSPSFTGLETPEEGAPHASPHVWSQPSLHTCPGPQWGSGAKAASQPWGNRTPAHSHHPAPPEGPVSSQVPFWPL